MIGYTFRHGDILDQDREPMGRLPVPAKDESPSICNVRDGASMLLMIDNYDSFTYNLVQYFGELGQEVRVYRNDEITAGRDRRSSSPSAS